MKTEVKLKLQKYCNKFKLLKINWIKKEDKGNIINIFREESAEGLSE
jgi:hypothetical protein